MKIEYDPVKDTKNNSKHGISLAYAVHLEWEVSLTWADTRFEYNEIRFSGIVPVGNKLFYVAFTEIDDDTLKIISLRKALKREVKRYVDQI